MFLELCLEYLSNGTGLTKDLLYTDTLLLRKGILPVVFTLLPSSGRTMPQSHTERYNVKSVWYWYPSIR